MSLKTAAKSLAELVHANLFSDFIPNNRLTREGYQFFDLHVHLPLPKEHEVHDFLTRLTSQVDGVTLAHYGRLQSGIETYDNIVQALKAAKPKDFSIKDKGLVTVVKDLETEKETLLFRSEEIDGTVQGLDIMLVGIKDFIPNPYQQFNYDARKIADLGRAQGAFTYLEHFCAVESKILPFVLEKYNNKEKRKMLFDVMDYVDAIEVFNGHCVLWLPPQNVHSWELAREYNKSRGINKPFLYGSDVHLGLNAVGTAGILIPALDSRLKDYEIIQQLSENIKKGIVDCKKDYNGLFSFIIQRRRLKQERERLKKQQA